jgi:putative Holliday junction resolvase
MGVLAIDPGTKKSGFATCDRLRIALSALDPFRSNGDDELLVDHVADLVDERDVSVLLVGLPLAPDGSDTERSRAVRGLVDRLRERFPHLDVLTHDETLTTKEAESRLRELGHTGRALKERRDSWAALVLLEDWVHSGEPRGSAEKG